MSSATDRYLTFLREAYTADDGAVRTRASAKYVEQLRAAHEGQKLQFDLTACLAGSEGFTGRVWFWSDLHLFHTNVIRYTDRPFADASSMNDTMMRNCLHLVQPSDILVFGGDITMGNVTATNELLRAIPGYKVNVLGNHDVDRKGKLLALEVDALVASLEFEFRGHAFFVSHYPVSEDVLEEGQLNLHGHIHNNALHRSLGTGARHLNMSVEHTGYQPVPLDWLLAHRTHVQAA